MLINDEIKKIKDLINPSSPDVVVTIDPGIGGTGLAFFEAKKLFQTEIIIPPSKLNWFMKCKYIAGIYESIILEHEPRYLIIEFPELWTGSATSQASAARGDLFKLTMLIGMFVQVVSREDIEIHLVTPQQWKGQMSKEVVDRRILRAIDQKFPNHVGDAVGIGLALLGTL